MKGHIRSRGRRSWQISFYIGKDPVTGKWLQHRETIRGAKKDAERALREQLQAFETGAYSKPTKKTVSVWLNEWCESYVLMHTRPRTVESYRSEIKNHISPALGETLLMQLHPQQLQNYYAQALVKGRRDHTGGLSARTVLYHHRIISEALDCAMRMGLVVRNVAKAVEPPKPQRVKMTILADIPAFIKAARQTTLFELFFTALSTGMRLGELLGLRWQDVNLDMGYFSVTQSLYKRGGVCMMTEPKSSHSRRRIALTPSLALLLRQYEVDQKANSLLFGKPLTGEDLVFANYKRGPLDPGTVSHAFSDTLKSAGLPHIRFHDLRHTHATLMFKQGTHPKIVSERLGHASVAFTLDIYSHTVAGLQEAAAESFDKMLGENGADIANLLPSKGDIEREPPGARTLNLLIKS